MNLANEKEKILIVDDIAENIDVLNEILTPDYVVKVALNGEKAIAIATSNDPPDLILLDVMMPDLDGYEVCRRLKENALTQKIPIIFVTAKDDITDETKGFELGAVDYITKPVSLPIVKARVRNHLALYDQTRLLEELVQKRTSELVQSQDITIHSLAVLAETRDNETGGHIMRTQHYVLKIAQYLSNHSEYRNYLDAKTIELLFKSAPLHDIGKVGIPDHVLLKPGKLSAEEFAVMQRHTIIGKDALLKAGETMRTSQTAFLWFAKEIAVSHHEKWDGSGYPYGLKGDEIPLSGRIMALADVYDAITSKRVYKPAFTHQQAVDIITQGDGRVRPEHFDPLVLEAFLHCQEEFKMIAQEYAD